MNPINLSAKGSVDSKDRQPFDPVTADTSLDKGSSLQPQPSGHPTAWILVAIGAVAVLVGLSFLSFLSTNREQAPQEASSLSAIPTSNLQTRSLTQSGTSLLGFSHGRL